MKSNISKLVILVCSLITLSKSSYAQTWQGLDSGVYTGSCYAILGDSINDLLYVGGNFDSIGHAILPSRGYAFWNGSSWGDLAGDWGEDRTSCITRWGNDIYNGLSNSGAIFKNYQSDSTRIFRGDDSVNVLTIYNSNLYAGGQFVRIATGLDSGLILNGIGRYDGTNWHPVGRGVHTKPGNGKAHIYGMCFWNNALYVAGRFDSAGNVPAKNIAKWDGTTWSAVDNGCRYADGSRSLIWVLYPYRDTLLIGGSFDLVGDNSTVGNVASYNANGVWGNLGVSFNGQSNRFKEYNGDLYIGGHFMYYENADSSRLVVRHNGWHPLGNIDGVRVIALDTWRSSLYIGGRYIYANNMLVNNIVRYTDIRARITPQGSTSICNGQSVTLNANVGSGYLYQWKLNGNDILGATRLSYSTGLGGNYSVYIYDMMGDSSTSAAMPVTVFPLPIVNLGPDTIICDTSNFTLDAGSGFKSYLWSTGATTQTIQVTSAYNYNVSDYWVQVIDSNNCSTSDTILVTVAVCTGVDQIKNPYNVKLFPNPAHNLLIISFVNPDNNELKVELDNELGQTVKNIFEGRSEKQYSTRIDVTQLPAGVYSVKLLSGDNVVTRKVVIEK